MPELKAFVLTAGFGTRLLPLTRVISKVSLPLAGVPVVVRVLRSLRRAGADRFVVNLHHGAVSVREALERFDEHPDYSPEPEILGTGGALGRVASLLDDAPFLLVNGDCLYGDIPLEAARRFHHEHGALATMVLLDMPAGESYSAVELGAGGRVVRIAGRPENVQASGTGLHFCGIHIIEPEFLVHVRPGFSDIVRDIYLPLIGQGAPIFGFHTGFAWHDLGTPFRYLEAQRAVLRAETVPPGHVLVGEGCSLAGDVRVGALAELGRGVSAGQGSRIERSVLCDRVRLGENCRVEDSILGPGVRLEDAEEMRTTLAALVDGVIERRKWNSD